MFRKRRKKKNGVVIRMVESGKWEEGERDGYTECVREKGNNVEIES